ncbi:MAG TPA: SDR family NAD(P)-dependent oxidoreductase, partial [Chloroflexota bacterium]|nr:SDR family NAD(P)-dependent oxidoreductase [Chloroflexota bacterium]
APQLTVIVVDVPVDEPRAAEWVLAEVAGAVGYSEAYYDSTGRRREAVLRLLPLVEPSSLPLSSDDVLLVTGGGKGIAAECALTLARETGARLLLIGRAKPADDSELAANLARLSSYGITYHYVSADVVDTEAVRTALQTGQTILGPVSGFLHGAGTNEPRLLRSLDEAAFARTLAPKLHGVRHVLDALDPDRLRLFVTFGSIIARTGLPGEADYAVANEWLTGVAEDFAAAHPRCRCLAIEWSVWSGVGMGQRLGRVDTLAHAGISPIPPERGVAILRQLIGQATSTVALVVTGRYGDVPTLKREQRNLPFQRFLENPRVYYPGVELVVDVELSRDSDPYLADHVFQGERLLPAVIGIEAMAQVAMALAGVDTPPVFTNVEFCRPVVVVDSDPVIARIAALKREDGRVDVVVRCEKTDFQVDHLRATCRFDDRCASDSPCLEAAPLSDGNSTTSAPLDDALQPSRDLYGKILFHGERFRRLRGYRRLTATQCVVEIVSDSEATWFGKYLPTDLVLGDPAVRDAAIHAIQACIPHATVLPVGVDRLLTTVLPTTGSLTAQAHERWRNGDTFCYDLEIIGDDGVPRERWEGLRLRQVGAASLPETWPIPLLRPYLERRLGELVASSRITVVLESAERRSDTTETDGVICRAVGRPVTIHRRPDGKPELMEGDTVSVAHSENLTLVVAGAQPLGCDLEIIVERPSVLWQDLLGISRYALAQRIAREVGESQGTAATRVWAAGEALKKGGAMPDVPIAMSEATSDGWVVLAAGAWRVPTVRLSLRANQDSRVLAFAIADAGRQKTPKRVEPSQFCPRAGDEIARRFGRFWDSPKAIPPSLI